MTVEKKRGNECIFVWIKKGLLLAVVFRAAWTDIRQRRISNELLGAALGGNLLLGLFETAVTGGKLAEVLAETWIASFLLVLGLLVLSFAFGGGLGMGDVKLMGISALYLGVPEACCCGFYGLLAAAFVSLALLTGKKRSLGDGLPLAPFLLAGYGWWMLAG